MTGDLSQELDKYLQIGFPVPEVLDLLHRHKALGATQAEVYSLLTALRERALDEATEDRILEVLDFVAGFCSPQMKIWGETEVR